MVNCEFVIYPMIVFDSPQILTVSLAFQVEIATWHVQLPQNVPSAVQVETASQLYVKLIPVLRVVLVAGVVWNAMETAANKAALKATVSCSVRMTQISASSAAQSTKTSAS